MTDTESARPFRLEQRLPEEGWTVVSTHAEQATAELKATDLGTKFHAQDYRVVNRDTGEVVHDAPAVGRPDEDPTAHVDDLPDPEDDAAEVES